MQAAKLRTERGIKPYTDNLVMKIQVSYRVSTTFELII